MVAAATPPTPRVPTPRYDYVRDGLEIYRRSFAMIRDEAALAGLSGDLATVATRIIHASGDTALVHDIKAHPDVVGAARAALRAGRPILTDSNMLASGITWRRLPAGNEVICTLRHEQVPAMAAAWHTTRAAAAVSLWEPHLDGAVVAIGNAPTALFHLLEMLHDGAPRPAAIVGMPVGFIGSAESKLALAAHELADGFTVPWLVLHGRRGGSAVAASAVNAIATPDELA
ncbi:MAG: precorrin-8X methylmutase [Ornithinimicrobium sp.]